MEFQQEDEKETKTAGVISENSQLSGAHSSNCKSAAEFSNDQLPCLVTEKKHGDLGVHDGAFGTFCIDREEIWICRLIALVHEFN